METLLYYQSSEIFPSFICALIETPIMQMCSKALKFRQRKFAIFTLRYLDTKTVGLFEGSFFLGGFDSLLHVLKRTNPILV